jgi:NAD(P)-dependent dehydrogenase (short-subunit alcohol dehydrogenase family)
VYILTRSESNAKEAIGTIQQSLKDVDGIKLGSLKFIHMNPEGLASVQSAAREFGSRESRLNISFNNAGVANVRGKTVQCLEYYHGVNREHITVTRNPTYPFDDSFLIGSSPCFVLALRT